MDEIIFKLWPYLEKLGAAGSVVLSGIVIWLLKDRTRLIDDNKELRKQYDAVQEQRIENAEKVTAQVTRIIEQNTAATQANAGLLRDVLHRGPS